MRNPACHDPLHEIETASIDELRHLQFQRMKKTLQHAYENSPMYADKFKAAGIHPDDLGSLDDLAKFPFTTKQDLGDNYPFRSFAVPMEEVVRIHASSGTTGKPTVVGYTKNDIDVWAGVAARSIRAAGGQALDKIHVSYGYGLFRVSWCSPVTKSDVSYGTDGFNWQGILRKPRKRARLARTGLWTNS